MPTPLLVILNLLRTASTRPPPPIVLNLPPFAVRLGLPTCTIRPIRATMRIVTVIAIVTVTAIAIGPTNPRGRCRRDRPLRAIVSAIAIGRCADESCSKTTQIENRSMNKGITMRIMGMR